MKKILHLLLLAPFWLACQSSDPAVFGIEPDYIAYNDEAPILKMTFCNDAKCDDPSFESRYVYNAEGKLSKIESYGRTASGKIELQYYTEHYYDNSGFLTSKIEFNRHGSLPGWVTYGESQYEYTGGVLQVEKTYFNQHQPDKKVLTGTITYEYKHGKKIGHKWTDDQNRFIRRVLYGYKNDVVNLETWYNDKDEVIRIFEHKFSGNRRQIGEYLLNSKEVLAMIEKTYDNKGRLATQETKVNNPLLCAMTPGLIKYSY